MDEADKCLISAVPASVPNAELLAEVLMNKKEQANSEIENNWKKMNINIIENNNLDFITNYLFKIN